MASTVTCIDGTNMFIVDYSYTCISLQSHIDRKTLKPGLLDERPAAANEEE
jgi:hypothetical protein